VCCLVWLQLAWNGLGNRGGQHLGSMLASNKTLESIDLSNCQLGSEAAFAIASGLKHNATLTALALNGNDLGEQGGRHISDALAANKELTHLDLQGCSFGRPLSTPVGRLMTPSKQARGNARASSSAFNADNPDGEYSLSLDKMGQRTVARELIDLAKAGRVRLVNPRLDGKRWTEATSPEDGVSPQLPAKGLLEMEVATVVSRRKRSDNSNAEASAIDAEDLSNICRQLGDDRASDIQKLLLLRMLVGGHYFNASQATQLLQAFGFGSAERIEAAVLLYPRLLDAEIAEEAMLVPAGFTERDIKAVFERLGILAEFFQGNASGHYELELDLDPHRAVATKLLQMAVLESHAKTWRNITIDGREVLETPRSFISEMPTHGHLRLDFTSTRAPPATSVPLDDAAVRQLNERLAQERAGPRGDAAALTLLRSQSVHLWVTSAGAAEIVAEFALPAARVEAAVTLFGRIVDQRSFYAVMRTLRSIEQSVAGIRIGWPHVFSSQAPTLHYRLDTSLAEHREILDKLSTIACTSDACPPGQQCFVNVVVAGRAMDNTLVESTPASIWGQLISSNNQLPGDATPWVEFDFFGPDAFEVLGRPEKARADRDMRGVLLGACSSQLLLMRARAMHPYWVSAYEEQAQARMGDDVVAQDESSAPMAPAREFAGTVGTRSLRRNSIPAARGSDGKEEDQRMLSWQRVYDLHCRMSVISEMRHLAPGYSPLRGCFDILDTDRSGDLSIKELTAGMAPVLGALGTDAESLAHGVGDGDDTVTWAEFEELVMDRLEELLYGEGRGTGADKATLANTEVRRGREALLGRVFTAALPKGGKRGTGKKQKVNRP